MESFNPWALIAAAFALASGFAWARLAQQAVRRRKVAARATSDAKESRVRAFFRAGAPPLLPLSRRILRIPAARRTVRGLGEELASRGMFLPSEVLTCWLILVIAVPSVLAGLASRSAVCALAVACALVVAVSASVRSRVEKREELMREEVPEVLRTMGVCFKSGFSLVQTMRQVSIDSPGDLGATFAVAARRLEMGASPREALSVLEEVEGVPELGFVAVALDVQHAGGGSIAPVLEAARESVEGELDLARSLRVQTAQAKLSARVVTVMPFLLVALFSLMSPGFLQPFFGSVAGLGLLALALTMQVAGVFAIRRMLKIEAG